MDAHAGLSRPMRRDFRPSILDGLLPAGPTAKLPSGSMSESPAVIIGVQIDVDVDGAIIIACLEHTPGAPPDCFPGHPAAQHLQRLQHRA